MTGHRAGGGHPPSGCERHTPTWAELQSELAELVETGVLEVVIGPDGVERYQRPEPPH